MENLINILRKLTPEMPYLIEKRYSILKNIYYYQPIGRRMLANRMNMTERIVRKDLDFLKEQQLINITPAGMELNLEGLEMINELQDFIKMIKGLNQLESRIKELLGIDGVHIVPGDVDTDLSVKKDMGKATAVIIRREMGDGSVIAVSGGSTLAEVAEQMPQLYTKNDIEVIPARGGLGEMVEYQANTIAAKLARKIGGKYKLLYVPDNLSREVLEKIITEPSVEEVVDKIKKADILIFSIGRSWDMADRRKLSSSLMRLVEEKGATAEALGFYFDARGNIVYTTTSVGLNLEDYSSIPRAIAVAGGTKKASAIIAANLFRTKTVLVTDEGAAKEIIRLSS